MAEVCLDAYEMVVCMKGDPSLLSPNDPYYRDAQKVTQNFWKRRYSIIAGYWAPLIPTSAEGKDAVPFCPVVLSLRRAPGFARLEGVFSPLRVQGPIKNGGFGNKQIQQVTQTMVFGDMWS